MPLQLPKIIGHRGAAGYAPENTLASFTKAKQLGTSWVEFDVQLTACETPIVFHDHYLSRTTNGHGLISKVTYSNIAHLDAGKWFDDSFANEPIPTLPQTIQHLTHLGLNANIELKTTELTSEKAVTAILSILDQHWPTQLAPPLLSSFCLTTLNLLQQYQCPWPRGLLLSRWQHNWAELMTKLGCISLHIHHSVLTAERAKLVKAAGFKLLAYTVNDPEQAKTLFDWGVDAILCDFPDRLI